MKLVIENSESDICKYHTGESMDFWEGYDLAIAHFDDDDKMPEDYVFSDKERGYMERIYEIVKLRKKLGTW